MNKDNILNIQINPRSEFMMLIHIGSRSHIETVKALSLKAFSMVLLVCSGLLESDMESALNWHYPSKGQTEPRPLHMTTSL